MLIRQQPAALSKWQAIFKDPMTTAAAIDKLAHHPVLPRSYALPIYSIAANKK